MKQSLEETLKEVELCKEIYRLYALRIPICLFVVKYPHKMKPASSANEAGFIGT